MESSNYSSRKFIIFSMSILTAIALPIVFKIVGISEGVTQTSMGIIFSSAGLYGWLNVKESVETVKAENAKPQ